MSQSDDMARERKAGGGRIAVVAVGVVIVLAVAGAFTLAGRRAELKTLTRETEAQAITTVSVVHPTRESAADELVLPSTLQPYTESSIYARTNGYLKKWYYDIGGRVAQGALLAEIDTPEIDQQITEAKASRDQISATLSLAKSSADRWELLRKTDAVSQQELDEKKSAYTQAQATLAAATANIQRLEQLESFKNIYAPFAGVITQRNVDVGTLINAGNTGTLQQLFHLAQTDPIRVYIQVPEAIAPSIHAGLDAYLELAQYPGERFTGTVVRTAGSIDPQSRTLQTEVDVPNRQGRLLPGGYAQVHLKAAGTGARLQVPVNALLFRAEGLRVAVVDANHRIRLRKLTIGHDYGATLEVLDGVTAEDWIVINPADSLADGQEVHVAETK